MQPISKFEQFIGSKNSRPLLIVTFILITTALIIFLVTSLSSSNNPYGDFTSISGLSFVSGLSKDYKNLITSQLYNTISSNLSDSSATPTSGAKVRRKSITYNDTDTIHSASFIVDIPSIKQSYRVSAEWSSSKTATSGYPVVVRCLGSTDEIIYPNFSCTDVFSDAVGSTLPLITYLPYYSNNFSLVATDLTGEKPKIEATILIHSYETAFSERNQKATLVKNDILDFIKNTNSNIEDYDITYSVEYGD
ncbi:hypothetical protein IJG98_03270 [Candidatus Saccharibacteria bacterium]|nr:hypothetical protein [Candidatus Saccharibacteria bacterium]